MIDAYPANQAFLRNWIRRGHLDSVAASVELLKRHIQSQQVYDEVLGETVQRANVESFIRDLQGDLRRQLRDWLKERMEPTANQPDLTPADRRYLLSLLTAAEGFEQILHTKYVGQKRFSLEGGDVLIPMLATLIEAGGEAGVEEIVMGMPHRGRLNVLANILRKPYEMIFAEFEGTFLPADIQGDGDVKYHLGYARDHTTRTGRQVHVSLCFNPSAPRSGQSGCRRVGARQAGPPRQPNHFRIKTTSGKPA